MPRVVSAFLLLVLCAPASALTGNAPPATGWAARPIVMIVDDKGDLCTGTALASDLVLTAAHCVSPLISYRIKVYQNGQPIPVRMALRHPQFDYTSYAASRATADIALLKLASPLPDVVIPAELAPLRRVAVGETLVIAGFGVTLSGTARGLGVPRMAKLNVTGRPGSLQIRLFDLATRNLRSGLGGCTGDSGAPVFESNQSVTPGQTTGQIIGIVSWSTAPNDEEGCGGLTGVTPILIYRSWLIESAKTLNSPIGP